METQKPARISNYRDITARPMFQVVALFNEAVEYDRRWCLPFHVLSLCTREDASDPSWVEMTETGGRFEYEPGQIHLIAAQTPMRIRCTTANHRLVIHFRYELFPGIDAFAGLRGRFPVDDPGGELAAKIRAIFEDDNPLRRYALAEIAALEAVRPIWPDRPALDLPRVAPYADTLDAIRARVDARMGVGDLARAMGVPENHFTRRFRALFGIPPKKWLECALFDRALRMLSDTRRAIRDVAYALEFSDEFNFSRFIKRRSGYSPSSLRAFPHSPVTDRR